MKPILNSLLIASNNTHKIKEIMDIFKVSKVDFKSLKDLSTKIEIIEDGKTFLENALIKAKKAYDLFKIPTLSDDSGLVVPFLNNQPGIYSARYAGEKATAQDNNQKLISEIKKNQQTILPAYFITKVVFYDKNQDIIINAEGKVMGKVITQLQGKNGFGYDPLFIPMGYQQTYAQLEEKTKNQISHRKKSLESIKLQIKQIYSLR